MQEKNLKKITAIIFIMLVFGFSLWNLFLPQKAFSETENRKLSLFPSWNEKQIKNGRWMQEFEQYASDQFLFRDEFMRVKTKTDLALGKKDNGKVYFGKDGYLISMDTLDERQKAANVVLLTSFLNKLNQREWNGTELHTSILLVPTAGTVERDCLPHYANVPNEEQALRNIEAQVKSGGSDPIFIHLMKVFSPINKEEKDSQMYYRTDHHWTTYGAYEAYRVWAEKNNLQPFEKKAFRIRLVTENFYGTNQAKAVGAEVAPDEIFSWSLKGEPKYRVEIKGENEVRNSLYDETFLSQKDKYAYFLGGNFGEMHIHTPLNNDKNLLIIKDSYANCFVPFLVGHFENIVVIDPRYFRGSIYEVIEKQEITDLLFLYNIVQFSNDRNFVYGVR